MEVFKLILNKIDNYDTITIFGHKMPDGDCYGSAVALKELILSNFKNKQVYILGSGCEKMYDTIGYMDEADDKIIKSSLGILVDASDFSRSEDERINLVKEAVLIDHHISNGKFIGLSLLDTQISSTCELIAENAIKHNLIITKKCANALFLGMVTDSVRFLYLHDGNKSHTIIAKLYEIGIDAEEIYAKVNASNMNVFSYKAYLSTHFDITENSVLYAYIEKDVYKKFKISFEQASSMVNLFASLEEVKIWCCFTERDDGTLRAELRSKKEYNVQPIAFKYGGGGHAQAAGISCLIGGKNKVREIINDLNKLI